MKYVYISLRRNAFPRFNILLQSVREDFPTSQDTTRVGQQCQRLCIALRLCAVLLCSALPIPHTEIPKQSCAAFASSKASARLRGRQGERGWGAQRTRDGVLFPLKDIFPKRFFLYLFLDSKLNHSINRWAYFVMIMYSAFQPLCVVYLIFFFTRALSLPLVFHFHFLLADQLNPPPTLPSLTFLTHFNQHNPLKQFLNRFDFRTQFVLQVITSPKLFFI